MGSDKAGIRSSVVASVCVSSFYAKGQWRNYFGSESIQEHELSVQIEGLIGARSCSERLVVGGYRQHNDATWNLRYA